jgi:hypothetical protein
MKLSICIVSSPAPCHPSIILVQSLINSLQYIPELKKCPILVICDGYIIANENRTKKGRVTKQLARCYEEYKQALILFFDECKASKDCEINGFVHSLDSHHGFAHAVKVGLTMCGHEYCLIAQHDREFIHTFNDIRILLEIMDRTKHIRYIGFPSVNSNCHNVVIQSKYRLNCLNSDDMVISIPTDSGCSIYLQPLIFWYDSQHICHVQRYLEIYQPYLNVPNHLKRLYGNKIMNGLVLRKGDFIEDRFGQSQLNSLLLLRDLNDNDLVKQAFLWYGSYLIWIPGDLYVNDVVSESIATDLSNIVPSSIMSDQSTHMIYPTLNHRAKSMVRHLRGRQLDLEREKMYEEERCKRSLIPTSISSPDEDSEIVDPISHSFESLDIFVNDS